MSGAREHVAEFWDEVLADFIAGRDAYRREPLPRWISAYRGKGEAAVDLRAFPEPYLGPLEEEPRAVFLAANPGPVRPSFQYADGRFVREISEEYDTYRAWAASWPYLREPWEQTSSHTTSRLRFLCDWYPDESLDSQNMVAFELYPWHSKQLQGQICVDPAIVREFILDPISEFRHPLAFAFGSDWFRVVREHPDIEVIDSLGLEGKRPYRGRVRSRSVLVGKTESGVTVVAEKKRNFAGPPASDEVRYLKEEIARHLPES